MRPHMPRSTGVLRLLLISALTALAACDGGDATGTSGGAGVDSLTVDASTQWAYVRLGQAAQQVQVADPASSTAWDIAFNATSVKLNGGALGPGGVVGYCVCQNGEVTGAQVQTLTAAGELADFTAVTSAQAPADAGLWKGDSVAAALTGWYAYDATAHVVTVAAGNAYKLRLAARPGQDTAYAKLRVVSLEGATQANAGKVTIEYAVQARRGAAMGAVQTRTLDVSAGGVTFDLLRGTSSGDGTWDLRVSGWTVTLNGGASGDGNAGVAPAGASFASVADASDLVAQQYVRDGAGGVFSAHPWYLYNVKGDDHQIWPTFQVYLVRRGAELYKVQVTGYYGPAGETRRITFRYARLAS